MFQKKIATASRVAGTGLALLIATLPARGQAPRAGGASLDVAEKARISEAYGKLPLTFEANQGQADGSVKYLGRGQGFTLFLSKDEALLNLSRNGHDSTVVGMKLDGANRDPHVVGVDPQETKSNYFLGNDPRQWHTGVEHYGKVRLEEVYPGIDLVYRGNQRQLEYDFVISPGADPGRIRLRFRNSEGVSIGAQGELIVHTEDGDLVEHAPIVYQETGAGRQLVDGKYVLLASRSAEKRIEAAGPRVGFRIGAYDSSRPLVIDPVLVYSTFLGGTATDVGNAIAVDGAGNAYVTGWTASATFPGVTGSSIQPTNHGGNADPAFEAFVTKINAAGTAIVYSTFLGGSGDDIAYGIAVDAAGNAYVAGQTDSASFPGVNGSSIQPAYGGGKHDGFVTKINAAGTAIVYSTYLGGSGDDAAYRIAVDSSGNAYVAGQTDSASFPGVNGSSLQPANGGGDDGFVTRINAAGTTILYSTFLGGTGSDYAGAIAVDGAGNAYVAGSTTSATFPGVNGGSIQPTNHGGEDDCFMTKINAAGTAIVYSTYLGGSGDDEVSGIAVDGAGNAYVAGSTTSATFPGVNGSSIQPTNHGGEEDSFVTKINAAGTAIAYSTFLGGSGVDIAGSIAVDSAGNAYVAGYTDSAAFPGVNGSSIQPANGGFDDGFVTKINASGTAIAYSTYLGGSGFDYAFGIAVDSAGNAYVAGRTGSTAFPGVNGSSIQPASAGHEDVFVTKIGADSVCGGADPATTLCLLDGRFKVSVTWKNQHANPATTGVGQAVADTSQTGSFYFFSPDAVELLVKVLDGRALNNSFWVFYGALSDVEYTITVTDIVTGHVKSYHNAPGNICGEADTSFSTTSSSSLDAAPASSADVESGLSELHSTGVLEIGADPEPEAASPQAIGSCVASAEHLCLLSNRFQVTVSWNDQHNPGHTGTGTAVASNDGSGYFWFFAANNLELAVKIIDGRSLTGKFWVFYGALSDVEYTITVTDTTNGNVKSYHNLPGNICGGADTNAL